MNRLAYKFGRRLAAALNAAELTPRDLYLWFYATLIIATICFIVWG